MITSAVGHQTPRGFTLSWAELNCSEVNAASVREYIVRYRRAGTEEEERKLVASESPFTFTDQSLITLAMYELRVAVVNTLGMGTFSAPVQAVILAGQLGLARPVLKIPGHQLSCYLNCTSVKLCSRTPGEVVKP